MLGIQQSIRTALCVGLVMATGLLARAQESVPEPVGEWHYYGGDKGFTRYSPLDQINLDNVGDLEILWRRPKVTAQLKQAFPDLNVNDNLRSTPIMIGGVLYAPNGVGLVEAFDAGTGKTVWGQEPFDSTPEGMRGSSSRGLDYWESGTDRRVFVARAGYLYALNARTGTYSTLTSAKTGASTSTATCRGQGTSGRAAARLSSAMLWSLPGTAGAVATSETRKKPLRRTYGVTTCVRASSCGRST